MMRRIQSDDRLVRPNPSDRTAPRASCRLVVPLCGVLVSFAAGCNGSGVPESSGAADASAPSGVSVPTRSTCQSAWETWDVVYMADTRVGTVQTVCEPPADDESRLMKTQSISRLSIPRYGETIAMETDVTSWETPDGKVDRFTYRTIAGPTPIVVEGRRRADGMYLTTTTTGAPAQTRLPWDESIGGFFAVEQSLRDKPMEPGETREMQVLTPGLAGVQIAAATLKAGGRETVDLPSGKRDLLRILHTIDLGEITIEVQCWTDPQGEVLKSHIPALRHTTCRVTRQEALESVAPGAFDLGRDLMVKINSPLHTPHRTARVVYRVTLRDEQPDRVFVTDASQRVEPIDDRSARLTVVAVRPGSELQADPEAPTDADRQPNPLIQSDDPAIVQFASEAIDGRTDPWEIVTRLEQRVHQAIDLKGFTHGFATAADVARTLGGDCTEHAVLLAALCRAAGIPARVAVGLVYSPVDQGFAFHMWNEAWVDDRWIPLDATLGLGGIGAAHLKLGLSDLATEQADSVMLRVLQVIQRLEIEVLETKRASLRLQTPHRACSVGR